MKRSRINRIVSVIVSGLLILSETASFTGCKSNDHGEVSKVTKDSVWYNSTSTELADKYKGQKTSYCDSEILGACKDGIVIKAVGSYVLPDDFDWEKDNFEDYNFTNIDYYDLKGELINSFDISKSFSVDEHKHIEDVFVGSDGVYLKILEADNGNEKCYLACADPATGTLGELKEITGSSDDSVQNGDMIIEGTWSVGDYVVSRYTKRSSYAFMICKGGNSRIVDLSVDPALSNIAYISGFITVSEKEILLVCLSNDVTFVSLDLETGEAANKDAEYSWLNTVNYSTRISSFDGKNYISDQNGVKFINFETKTLEEVLSYNNCNINRYTAGRMKLVSIEDSRYVFADMARHEDSVSMYQGSGQTPVIEVIERSDTNPNAGKIIITAAIAGTFEMSYPLCEAVRVFNETCGEYYVQLENKLNVADFYDFSNAKSHDDQMGINYSGTSELGDKLASDMISGNGPDIVLNAAAFSQIQSEEYLVDLNSYIKGKNGINEADYFSNVIDAAKIDDKLFYMPVSFTVSGIQTIKSNISEGQTGFTFDQYIKFVDEVCNGKDPMNETQLGVLCTLYSYMNDTCIDGKTVNFDNESFRTLCDYVKDNVVDSFYDENESDGTGWYNSFGDFLFVNGYNSSSLTLMGYPSIDGRGPVISIDTSVGISSAAPSAVADGAWKFIKTCMSSDIQDLVARDYSNPMSAAAFDSTAQIALENYNKVNPLQKLDGNVADSYKEVLLSASVTDNADPAVLVVIREEIPPYLLDQKSFDAVLKILQDRVTTIIAERK